MYMYHTYIDTTSTLILHIDGRSIKALKLALELFAPSDASNAAPELSALARSGEGRALHGLASACGRLEERARDHSGNCEKKGKQIHIYVHIYIYTYIYIYIFVHVDRLIYVYMYISRRKYIDIKSIHVCGLHSSYFHGF